MVQAMTGLLVACVALLGCETSSPSALPTNAATSDCPARTADLRRFLGRIVDRAQTVAAPWPTGDAAFDAELTTLRDAARARAAPSDPAARQKPLTDGVGPSRLEQELASCPGATAQHRRVGEVSPDLRVKTFVGIADAIGACGCTPNLPRIKALFYLAYRGPD